MTTTTGEPLATRQFQRFSVSQRVQHAIQIVSFSLLCFTGLLQKFSDFGVCETLIVLLGGIERLRVVHRITAIVFMAEAAYHVAEVAWLLVVRREKPIMIPTLKDAKDARDMILYFLGRRIQKARFGRYDFKQKTEYLSLLWGSVVMIATGLMMWYPVIVTRLLPGEFIPAARVAHGGEGLLAFLAIFVWHLYGAAFSPEVFPLDTSIFTGKISEHRMKEEHPLEYEELMALAPVVAAPVAAIPPAPTALPSVIVAETHYPAPIQSEVRSRLAPDPATTRNLPLSRPTSSTTRVAVPWDTTMSYATPSATAPKRDLQVDDAVAYLSDEDLEDVPTGQVGTQLRNR